jgi:hypothetical protein
MAQDLPATDPQWDSTNANSTEPTTQKTAGWAAGVPKRQYDSWHKQWTWRWLRWFRETIARNDLMEDQPVAGLGTAPSVGAGGQAAANEFSAAVWAGSGTGGGGYRRELTTGPAALHNYAGVGSGGRDTYWSLSRGGVWTATDVAPGAAEPAVPANSVFVYAVAVDNAGVKTLLKDYRPSRGRITKALDAIDFRALTKSTALAIASTNAELIAPLRKLLLDKRGIPGGQYRCQVIWQGETTGTGRKWQLVAFGAENDDIRWILAQGARVTTADGALGATWTIDTASIERWTFEPGTGQISRQALTGQTPGATMTEAAWYDQSSTQKREIPLLGGLVLGTSMGLSSATANIIPLIRFVRGLAGALEWTDLVGDTAGSQWHIHTGPGFSGTDACFAIVFNAQWVDASNHWARFDNSKNAFIIAITANGIVCASHPSTSAATWANTLVTDNSTWRSHVSIGGSSMFAQTLFVSDASSLSISPNTLYQRNIPKAWAWLRTDGAGDILIAETFGCTVSVAAGAPGHVVVDLETPMASTDYSVQVSQEQTASLGLAVQGCAWKIIDDQTVHLFPYSIAAATGVVTQQDPESVDLQLSVQIFGVQV